MGRICITLSDELEAWISDEAEKGGVTKSEAISRIIDQQVRTPAHQMSTEVITHLEELVQHLKDENTHLWNLIHEVKALPPPRRSFWDWVRGR